MSPLMEKQVRYARCLGKLLTYAAEQGIPVRMGECWRSPEEAQRLATIGRGIILSVHRDRLACDLLVGDDMDEEPYAVLGAYWTTLDPEAVWGGTFGPRRAGKQGPGSDRYHFSFAHGGRK